MRQKITGQKTAKIPTKYKGPQTSNKTKETTEGAQIVLPYGWIPTSGFIATLDAVQDIHLSFHTERLAEQSFAEVKLQAPSDM